MDRMESEGIKNLATMLEFFIDDTMKLAEKVVNEKQAETSAVTTKRRIELYIDLSKEIYKEFQLSSFQEVISKRAYSEEFIKQFEEKLSEELKYVKNLKKKSRKEDEEDYLLTMKNVHSVKLKD